MICVMRIAPLPLIIGLLPLLAVTLCLQLSQAEGFVPHCNPLLEGCTTISRAGRHGSAYHLFKMLMLPSAGLMLVFWPVAGAWLGHRARPVGGPAMTLLGLFAAAMLALYSAFLGTEGALFASYRRIGASSFLAGTFFCQLLFALSLQRRPAAAPALLRGLLLGLVGAQLMLGLVSLPFTLLAEPSIKDAAENIIEWWFALALIAFFFVCACLWRDERLDLRERIPGATNEDS